MVSRSPQLRLDLGDQRLWDQLEEETKQRCLALLSQLLQEVWREDKETEEDEGHDREAKNVAS